MNASKNSPGPPNRARGFSLIELMAVVVVIAILAVIAFPSFMSQIRASRRAEAIAMLSVIQQAQERWRANCPCYAGSLTAAPSASSPAGCPAVDCANSAGLGLTLTNPRYAFAMPSAPAIATPNTYTIAASAVGTQALDRATGTSCGVLSVVVTNGVPAQTPAACFRQ